MSVDVEQLESKDVDSYLQYRALSSLAVASLLLGFASVFSFTAWWYLAVPAIGFVLGWLGYRRVARAKHELSGKGVAAAGMVLSALFAFLGAGYLGYVYATEVPEGFERIGYELLQPDPDVASELIPASAKSLEGKHIFIKGYVYPGQQTSGITQFLLVRDQGSCCFGGNPKVTDRIQVKLKDPLTLTFETRLFKLAGVFHVEEAKAADATGAVYYHLEATHLE